jgi:hypothetical protein
MPSFGGELNPEAALRKISQYVKYIYIHTQYIRSMKRIFLRPNPSFPLSRSS